MSWNPPSSARRRPVAANVPLVPLQAQASTAASGHMAAASRDSSSSFGQRRSASARQQQQQHHDRHYREDEHIHRKGDGSVEVSWVPTPKSSRPPSLSEVFAVVQSCKRLALPRRWGSAQGYVFSLPLVGSSFRENGLLPRRNHDGGWPGKVETHYNSDLPEPVGDITTLPGPRPGFVLKNITVVKGLDRQTYIFHFIPKTPGVREKLCSLKVEIQTYI